MQGTKSPASAKALASSLKALDERLFKTNRYLSFIADSLRRIADSSRDREHGAPVSCDVNGATPTAGDETEILPYFCQPSLPFPDLYDNDDERARSKPVNGEGREKGDLPCDDFHAVDTDDLDFTAEGELLRG